MNFKHSGHQSILITCGSAGTTANNLACVVEAGLSHIKKFEVDLLNNVQIKSNKAKDRCPILSMTMTYCDGSADFSELPKTSDL